MANFSKIQLTDSDAFIHRHIGPTPETIQEMASTLGVSTLDQLIEQAVPREPSPTKLTL